MATNEIYKHGQWVTLPLPLRGSNPALNADPTRPGDPVRIGSAIGFVQEVGGKPVTYSIGSTTVTQSTNHANSLAPGWASVALTGAFAFPVEGWDPVTMGSGTPVGIIAATGSTRARLTANAKNSAWFGYIVGQTLDPMLDTSGDPVGEGINIPIVLIDPAAPGTVNTVADRTASGS